MNCDKTINLEKSLSDIKNTGAFLTSGNKRKANTMTISWAGMGYMMKKNIFIILISNIRYTKEFIDKENTFTISIPYAEKMDRTLDICGHTSGRDADKKKITDIEYDYGKKVDSPIVKGCAAYYECRVIFNQKIDVNDINPQLNLDDDENGHTMYFGEIVEAYTR